MPVKHFRSRSRSSRARALVAQRASTKTSDLAREQQNTRTLGWDRTSDRTKAIAWISSRQRTRRSTINSRYAIQVDASGVCAAVRRMASSPARLRLASRAPKPIIGTPNPRSSRIQRKCSVHLHGPHSARRGMISRATRSARCRRANDSCGVATTAPRSTRAAKGRRLAAISPCCGACGTRSRPIQRRSCLEDITSTVSLDKAPAARACRRMNGWRAIVSGSE